MKELLRKILRKIKNIPTRYLLLQESERRYYSLYDQLRNYFDLVQVMIVILDREGRVASINRKGCEILGYKEEEIIGKNWFDNFIPESYLMWL